MTSTTHMRAAWEIERLRGQIKNWELWEQSQPDCLNCNERRKLVHMMRLAVTQERPSKLVIELLESAADEIERLHHIVVEARKLLGENFERGIDEGCCRRAKRDLVN